MFERFTGASRRALFYARYEVSEMGAKEIRPEHLLIGVVRVSVGALERLLDSAGVSLAAVRREIERTATRGEKVSTSLEIPFTAATQAVLRAAVAEADGAGHDDVGPQHLLLALFEPDDSVPATILSSHGLHAADVRAQVGSLSDHSTEQTLAAEGISTAEHAVDLYTQLLEAWNRRNADAFAALFAGTGSTVGFDGSQMNGRGEIASSLRAIFASHETASYVARVREVRQLDDRTVLLRAVAGMVPPGKQEIKPDVNAVQSVVFVGGSDGLAIALLQNTPAAFHGRPDLADQLTEELSAVLRAGRVVDGP